MVITVHERSGESSAAGRPQQENDTNLKPIVKRIGPPQNPPNVALRSILRMRKVSLNPNRSASNQKLHYEDLTDTDLFLEFGVNSAAAVDMNLKSGTHGTESPIDDGEASNVVYALHTFVATLEGQVCVLKGDSLALLDDSNSYWWLVRCLKTAEVGYIPAENIENYNERLARLNKLRNVRIAAPQAPDFDNQQQYFGQTTNRSDSDNKVEALSEWGNVVRPFTLDSRESSIIQSTSAVRGSSQSPSIAAKRKLRIAEKVVAIRHSDDGLDATNDPDTVISINDEDVPGSQSCKPDPDTDNFTANSIHLNSISARAVRRISTSASSLVKRVKENARRLIEGAFSAETTAFDDAIVGEMETANNFESARSLSDPSINASETSREKTSKKKARDSFGFVTLLKGPKSVSGDVVEGNKSPSIESKQHRKQPHSIEKTASVARVTGDASPAAADTTSSSSHEQKMVLKIFSGNYDFKANYKSIAVTRESTVEDVVRMAIIRFRVPEMISMKQALQVSEDERVANGTPETAKKQILIDQSKINLQDIEKKYYLSVVHGDSKERLLNRSDIIFDILLKLQSKLHIPGVSAGPGREFIKQLKHVNTNGLVSSITTPNESEIRFLLNRAEDQDQSSSSKTAARTSRIEDIQIPGMKMDKFLVRVYYYGDDFGTGTIYSVKTLGVSVIDTVAEVIQQCIEKFKLRKARRASEPLVDVVKFSLWQTAEQVSKTDSGVGETRSLSDTFKSPVRISFRPVRKLEADGCMGQIVRLMIKEGNIGVTSDEIAFVLSSADTTGNPESISSEPSIISTNPPADPSSSIFDILVHDDDSSKLITTEDSISLKKLREHLRCTTITDENKESKEGRTNHNGDDDEGMYSILDSYIIEPNSHAALSKHQPKQTRVAITTISEVAETIPIERTNSCQGDNVVP